MVYVKQNWLDAPATSTPISAARLNKLETQYDESVLDLVPRLAVANQVYTSGSGGEAVGVPLTSAVTSNAAVRRSGTQILTDLLPVSNSHVASKKYVDDMVATGGGSGGVTKAYVDAADATLTSSINSVASFAASVDDLSASFYMSNIRSAGAAVDITTGVNNTIWVAPRACTITSMVLLFEYYTLAASSTNYWTFTLRKSNAAQASPVNMVVKSTNSVGGEGITARTPWSMTGGLSNTSMAAGQLLQLNIGSPTGAPSSIQLPLMAVWTYRPVR